jgi:dUTP pyrophosphatase
VIQSIPAVEVLLLQVDPGLERPSYAHPGDAGADLRSRESFELQPGERRLVGTGVAISLPVGYAAFVHPRSGLAAEHGISIVNAPGTIDAGYRGEIKVCLINTDRTEAVSIARGDRIAQLVIQPVSTAAFVPVTELPSSSRGSGGYGSTGGILGSAISGGYSARRHPATGQEHECA